MILKKNRGLTLVESLISILLLSTLLVSILGAFYISRLCDEHSRHRLIAMNEIKKYIEEEISFGFNEGNYGTVASSAAVDVPDLSDVGGTIKPDPYPPTITTVGTSSFRTIGFIVEWTERFMGIGNKCREKVLVYVQ